MGNSVNVELDRNEALVLVEFLRRISDNGDWSVEDTSEVRALWNLQSLLEKSLPEILEPNYNEAVEAARDALRDPEGTNSSAEKATGRLAFWMEPKDIAFIADEWRKVSDSKSDGVREQWGRIAFRAMSALHKAGIKYEPRFPSDEPEGAGAA